MKNTAAQLSCLVQGTSYQREAFDNVMRQCVFSFTRFQFFIPGLHQILDRPNLKMPEISGKHRHCVMRYGIINVEINFSVLH